MVEGGGGDDAMAGSRCSESLLFPLPGERLGRRAILLESVEVKMLWYAEGVCVCLVWYQTSRHGYVQGRTAISVVKWWAGRDDAHVLLVEM